MIDLALGREPWAADAASLFQELERRPKMAFVAWHTLSNVYYLVRPSHGSASVREFLVDLTRLAAARACGARMIATRNASDYEGSPIPARSPAEVVAEL